MKSNLLSHWWQIFFFLKIELRSYHLQCGLKILWEGVERWHERKWGGVEEKRERKETEKEQERWRWAKTRKIRERCKETRGEKELALKMDEIYLSFSFNIKLCHCGGNILEKPAVWLCQTWISTENMYGWDDSWCNQHGSSQHDSFQQEVFVLHRSGICLHTMMVLWGFEE